MEDIDKNTFKKIFHDHWDAFKQLRPRFDNPDYNETVNKMLDCGDPDKMGFVQYRCCYCGEIRRIAFTCKSYALKFGSTLYLQDRAYVTAGVCLTADLNMT